MIRIAARRVGFLLQLLTFYAALGPLSAYAQVTGGDVSASVPEAGAQALAGALADATVESSSGVLKASLPIALPSARGTSQPGLALTYSSAAGVREAGVGWGLLLPVIQRSTKRGAPTLADYLEKPEPLSRKSPELPEPDELLFNGVRLIPICEVGSAKKPCDLLGAEPLPGWALGAGTRYYRLEIDSSHARFFWSPGRATWRIQLPDGEILELGRPQARELVEGATTVDPDASLDYDELTNLVAKPDVRETVVTQRVPFRWNLVRRYNPSPSGEAPYNVVFYRWAKLGSTGLGYLTDVYYSPPANIRDKPRSPIAADSFAHHVHLAWDFIPQAGNNYTPTWRATPNFTLGRVDVASKRYGQANRPRELVRRYHLTYKGNQRAYLQAFQMEGRCAVPVEEVNGQLPATVCNRMPATTLRWSQPEQNRRHTVLNADHGFPLQPSQDWRLIPLDINADGFPDLVETNPAFEPNEHAGDDGGFGFRATMTRRVYIHDDRFFFKEHSLKGPAGLFSRFGYSLTGDYHGRARTSAILFTPMVFTIVDCAPEGPCQRPVVYISLTGVDFEIEHIGNTRGQQSWNWQDVASWGAGSLGVLGGPNEYRIEAVGDVNGDGVPDIVDTHSDRGDDETSDIDVQFGISQIPVDSVSKPLVVVGWRCKPES